ncbi:MAG: hypothetical protein GXX81_07745 [Acidobacteria bacterium]|jgi:hypothetical protein|nr:hypothetical protein [Acidobacteriota bacterium]
MNIPSVPIVLSEFYEQEVEKARNDGLPGLRTQWIRGPVWAKTRDELRRDVINGKNPITGQPVMKEIVEKFTKPLTEEERQTGEIKRTRGPDTFTDTAENLHKMFLDKRYTDFLPIVLPTPERVADMLKGTSHDPDETVGKMSPTQTGTYFEDWTYTVRDVAVNAVMAGCRPEYFPLLLAVASTGKEAISVSDNSFVGALVINGTIRDEIGLNYKVGAMGPYAHANTTIGRAWSLMSINLGNGGKVGTTYMGVVGNPMNLINIVIAENEEESPWEPFSVRKGFRKGENVVSLFEGWGVLSAANWKAASWGAEMNYPRIIKEIFDQQGFLFGACAVLSPPIAQFVKNAGYETVEEFEKYLEPAPQFPMGKMAPPKAKPESGAQAKAAAKTEMPPMMGGYSNSAIIVTGGTNNNYYSVGGLRYGRSVKIDDWR